jgi:hypothetical protein
MTSAFLYDRFDTNTSKQDSTLASIIESSLMDVYGMIGYKSIIQTMVKESGYMEQEITSNYDLFTKLVEDIFGKVGCTKILDPVNTYLAKVKPM